MAEINHSDFRNFSPPGTFKYIEAGGRQKDRKAGDQRSDVPGSLGRLSVPGSGGGYALHEIFGDVGGDDGSDGVFAGTGTSRSGHWSRAGLCGRASGLRVWILRLRSLRLRAVRLLRASVLRERLLCWCGAVVSLGTSGGLLAWGICRPWVLWPSVCWPAVLRPSGSRAWAGGTWLRRSRPGVPWWRWVSRRRRIPWWWRIPRWRRTPLSSLWGREETAGSAGLPAVAVFRRRLESFRIWMQPLCGPSGDLSPLETNSVPAACSPEAEPRISRPWPATAWLHQAAAETLR